jgi:hypothetical protein
MVRWKHSIFPFVCGRYGRVLSGRMPSSTQVSRQACDVYALPLSDRTRSTRTPRSLNQDTARRSTPIAVSAASSWISAYATLECHR